MSFKILTDTSANIPTPYLKKNDVDVIAFSYIIGDEVLTCTDTETFDSEPYYDKIRNGLFVKTSQISPQLYADFFRPYLERGEEFIYISMSSGISGSFNSAQIGMQMLEDEFPNAKVRLIDSLGASLGQGILVFRALECRRKGLSLDETADWLLEHRWSIAQIATVDDIMFLKRTGRVSGAVAVVGAVLGIKPVVKGNSDGQLVMYNVVRGRKQALQFLAKKYDEFVFEPENQTVGIAHAGCRNDANYLAELLKRNNPPKEILVVDYEPVTGAHIGPGTVALFFESTKGVRER